MAGTKSQAGTTTDNSIKDTNNEQETLSYSFIGTIIGITVSLLVIAVVVGLLFRLCYCKRFLCFKKKAKYDVERLYIAMVKKTTKTSDLDVDVEDKNTSDTTEDEVDISSENTKSPVCVYEYTSKYSNIQPTDARE
jgi:hypothetical protein